MNKSAARRMLLYWLLLLMPTLAVGTGAVWLLHREQLRIDAQTRATAGTRRAAVEARARLIAENVETLVADVQTGLMGTLWEAPLDDPAPFLARWKKSNPLVREVFQVSASGHPLWGNETGTLAGWFDSTPWKIATAPQIAQGNFSPPGDSTAIGKIYDNNLSPEYNRLQYQNVRQNIQIASTLNAVSLKTALSNSLPLPLAEGNQRTGWAPWFDTERSLHLLGWRICADGTVLVVEANLQTLAANLAEVLPAQLEPDEAYALRLDTGKTVREAGSWATGDRAPKLSRSAAYASSTATPPTVVVPLAAEFLPGWTVAGFLRPAASFSGNTFFYTSSVLVGIFVLTILCGGALLLRQARLSEMDSARKTSFVANVSHEFKTPLTTIRLYAELLEQGRVRDDTARTACLQTISRETRRLARLVNNVLDFSRLEQGQKKFTRARTDLAAALRTLLDRHAPRLAEAGLRLEQHLPDAPLWNDTDPDALEQIILNLLENACKYAASGGEVTVALETPPNGAGAMLRVADRGPGIPAGQSERVFEKFHRVDDTLTAAQNGTGLGLSIARQLARGLGGELRHAPRPGGGSEFILTLPQTTTPP